MVENAWHQASREGPFSVLEGIKRVHDHEELFDWNKTVLGDLEKRIKKVKNDLNKFMKGEISQERVSRELTLWDKLCRLENQLDVYWKQRAHAHRLAKGGPEHQFFFHVSAYERKRRNTIRRHMREDGNWVAGENQLKELISNRFSNLLA